MSTAIDRPSFSELRHGLHALRGNWFWFVLLGIALIVLGFVCVGSVVVAGLATAMAIGALLLLGGVVEIVGAFGAAPGAVFFCICSPACCRW